MSSLSNEFKSHMVKIVNDTMEYREKNNVSRKDFIQLLMELRKTGKVNDDEESDVTEQSKDNPKEFMTIEQCAAQVALFYLAGFDTTASAVAYTLYELSRNPDLMRCLHEEIDEVLERHNNEISYESINEMTFLENCVLGNTFVAIIIKIQANFTFFIRIIAIVSNFTVSQSYLYEGILSTEYGFGD